MLYLKKYSNLIIHKIYDTKSNAIFILYKTTHIYKRIRLMIYIIYLKI